MDNNMSVGATEQIGHAGYIKKDFGWSEVSIEEAVYQAVGAASVCWSDMAGTGVFEDAKARNVAEQLLERIRNEFIVPVQSDTTEGPINAEWIERQEEERRAWAINTAVEHLHHRQTRTKLIELAGEIEAFVIGPDKEDPDLHDQDAFDTWGVVMTEQLAEMLYQKSPADLTDQQRDYIEARLNDFSDSLTKAGVRFKDGEKFERLIDPGP